MTKKELVAFITKEIEWCLNTPYPVSKEFKEGFIAGLELVISLAYLKPNEKET